MNVPRNRSDALSTDVLSPPRTQWFVDRSDRRDREGLYCHMFREDVQNRVIPYLMGREEEAFEAIFVGASDEVAIARLLLETLSREGYRSDDREAIVDAVRAVAQALVWDNVASYEILNSTSTGAYGVSYIPGSTLTRLPLGALQYITNPLPTGQQRGKEKRKITWVPARSLWQVRFPRLITTTRRYRRMMKILDKASKFAPDFWAERQDKRGAAFDWDVYRFEQHIARAACTAAWGWPMRNSELQDITEYYYFFRDLRFEAAVATLRVHIISELNGLLRRLNIRATIQLSGLFTPEEISGVAQQIEQGALPFGAAIDVSRNRRRSGAGQAKES